ncbi:hypothetical protein ACFL5Q_07275 [Planctomycetota bacterium]
MDTSSRPVPCGTGLYGLKFPMLRRCNAGGDGTLELTGALGPRLPMLRRRLAPEDIDAPGMTVGYALPVLYRE